MKAIGKQEVLDLLASRQKSGDHIDSRLFEAIPLSQRLYLFELRDEESFFSLIWQARKGTRLLTPKGESRTLNEVAARMLTWQSFPRLASDLGLPEMEHCPSWFDRCVLVDSAFDYDRFGWISVVHPNDAERRESPSGSFYIYDGVHRSLVLAKRLRGRESQFKGVTLLLITPRPS